MKRRIDLDEMRRVMESLPFWRHRDGALTRDFQFLGFRDAMTFMQRASFVAEALGHHPTWTNVQALVGVRLTTPEAGNRVTGHDVELARSLDRIYDQMYGG